MCATSQMANITVSKHLRMLGTGTLANDAVSIAAWTPGSGRWPKPLPMD